MEEKVEIATKEQEVMEQESRRQFLVGVGKWSTAVAALALGLIPGRSSGGRWINARRGGGWANRVGGGGWVNRRGGGHWANARAGGWINRAGGWVNRSAGGSWANRRGGGGWANIIR